MTKQTLYESFIKIWISYITAIPSFLLFAPFATIYDLVTLNRNFAAGSNSPSKHHEKVTSIQNQIKDWNKNGRPNRMCTGRAAWKTLSVHNMKKGNYTQIDIDLDDVVEIDTVKKVLTVEPGMMMGKLSSILLPQGWTIPLIPEFETLTIGGCICGTGIETSSHKYGLSSDICISYEVVLASGELVNCSKAENIDLFYSIPWSHGTLGFLTAVKIPLIPASKYVKVEYFPCNSIQEAKYLLQAQGHDFVEGIMFGPRQVVVMFGDMVNKAESSKINYINSWYKPWFFKYVETHLNKSKTNNKNNNNNNNNNKNVIDYIPLRDYYHRHTRGFFWETQYVLPYGNSILFRLLFGWLYPLNFQLLKLFVPLSFWEAYFVTNHVLQDFIVPINKLESSLEFVHQHIEVYPLWLCPCKFFNKPGMVHSIGKTDELFIDIGIYGDTPKVEEFEPEKSIRAIEKFAIDNHGVQFLYADSYMTKDEFKKMFDMKLYDSVRKEYECDDAFPHVYDKVSRHARKIVSNLGN